METYKRENALTESQPPKPTSEFENQPIVVEGTTQLLKVSFRMMTIMCYMPFLSLVAAVAALATEPISNKFVRFHAWQSLFLIGIVFAISVVVTFLSAMMPLLAMINLVLTLTYMHRSVMMMLDANKGKMTKLPLIGDWADGML